MSDFGEGNWIKGRKDHRCAGCGARIPKGEDHYNYRGIYGGDWQNWRMHEECHAAYDADGDDEFIEGDYPVPDRIRSMYEQVSA